jgi:transposase
MVEFIEAASRPPAPRRQPGFDKDRYKQRNAVEWAITKLKQFRAVVTCYDKRGYVYLGTVTAAALLIWLRS